MATIYYLNWDNEHKQKPDDPLGPASELFHKLTVEEVLEPEEKPAREYTETEFNKLYREISTVEDPDSLEQLWKRWNAGSRQESQEFYNAEVRSMSVGDVVELDGSYYQAKNVGWEEIEVGD